MILLNNSFFYSKKWLPSTDALPIFVTNFQYRVPTAPITCRSDPASPDDHPNGHPIGILMEDNNITEYTMGKFGIDPVDEDTALTKDT